MTLSIKMTRHSMMLLMALLPAGQLAAWSEPGKDFNSELTLGGQVTSLRNPWQLKVGNALSGLQVSEAEGTNLKGERVWKGLMKDDVVLLARTTLTTPAGREGLIPVVSFGKDSQGVDLNWLQDGEGELSLPVYIPESPGEAVGTLKFRVQSAAVIHHVQHGKALHSAIYNDLTNNGLAGQHQAMEPERAVVMLCSLFGTDAPLWLCDSSKIDARTIPLTQFASCEKRQVQGVYGAKTVASSGELRIASGFQPCSWKATLSVSMVYQ